MGSEMEDGDEKLQEQLPIDDRSDGCAPKWLPFNRLQGNPRSLTASAKIINIMAACDKQDIRVLAGLATSQDGLVDDEVRRIAWPILLGYEVEEVNREANPRMWQELPRHKDEDQVELDVNRSFIYYPKNESSQQLDRRKSQLSDVIINILRQHPQLSYFQGFHDIVQVFLLVLGVSQAPVAVTHLSLLRIRDFMLPSLSPTLVHLRLLPAILYAADMKLCQHLSQTQPFFALAATLTLYAHDIQEYGDIARLFDFLLAQEAVVSVYFFAVIVLSRRRELFDIPADEPEMLHSILSKLPKPLDLEALISRTTRLFTEHPPDRLPFAAWAQVSSYSVLKTTRGLSHKRTLKDGEELFAKQTLQLRRAEVRQRALAMLWKYRRPAGGIGLAVFVGVLSFWLRRTGIEGIPRFRLRKIWL